MKKNGFVLSPRSHSHIFGFIPEIDSRGYYFPRGEIRLRHGQHVGPNKGFGVAHIWAEHEAMLKKSGYTAIEDVARYVADIIIPGAPLYCEFNNLRGKHRVAVLRSAFGQAIVEYRQDEKNNGFYSVVTAFESKKPHGTMIGRVAL